MSRKLQANTTKDFLKNVPLPIHGGRYTPIGHGSIIDTSLAELAANNLTVIAELYRSTLTGNIANGIVLVDHGSEMDMKMVLAWGNSYDKSTKFTCGIGAYIMSTKTFMFAGDLSNFIRKHTGKADQEAVERIKEQVSNANKYYDILVETKKKLEVINLTERQIAHAIGVLLVEKQALTKEQVGGIFDMIKTKQVLFDGLEYTNAWNVYNIFAKYLRESHPKVWFQSQFEVHRYFMDEIVKQIVPVAVKEDIAVLGSDVPEVPTNQLNLFDAIAEAEKEQELEQCPEPEEETTINSLQEEEEIVGDSDEFVTFDTGSDNSFELPEL